MNHDDRISTDPAEDPARDALFQRIQDQLEVECRQIDTDFRGKLAPASTFAERTRGFLAAFVADARTHADSLKVIAADLEKDRKAAVREASESLPGYEFIAPEPERDIAELASDLRMFADAIEESASLWLVDLADVFFKVEVPKVPRQIP